MVRGHSSVPFLLTLLVLIAPLTGCMSDGTDGEDGDSGPAGPRGIAGERGDSGLNGTDGMNGTNGTDGMNGTNGTDGMDGVDGLSALAIIAEEAPGVNCEAGGVRLFVGIDDNGDGILQSFEVDDNSFICNGTDGDDAENSGGPSLGTLTQIYTLGKSDGCPAGGRIILTGLDNGDGGGILGNGILEIQEVDYSIRHCSSHGIDRLTDINPGRNNSHPGKWYYPGWAGGIHSIIDGVLYLSAYEASTGSELWAYDLTTKSVWQVADINNGTNGSSPGLTMSVVLGHTIFFSAYTDGSGNEFWAHDTRTNQTTLLGPGLYNPGDDMAVVMGNNVYFSAYTAQYATELWAYSTSNQTTWNVVDIHQGSSSNPGWYMNFIYEDVLYFSARDIDNVHDIYAYNHSNGTTWQVISVTDYYPFTHPGKNFHVVVDDVLYFDADDEAHGREIWAYNFTSRMTWMVDDIIAGPQGSNPGSNISEVIGGTIYFDIDENKLMALNLSSQTSIIVEQFSVLSSEGSEEIQLDGVLYFMADDGNSGNELWAHSTHNSSTWMVEDINAGLNNSQAATNFIIEIDGIIYFDAISGNYGREMWAHDPIEGSTWQIADINRGMYNGSKPGLRFSVFHEGVLYFDASSEEHGAELWSLYFTHTVSYNSDISGY